MFHPLSPSMYSRTWSWNDTPTLFFSVVVSIITGFILHLNVFDLNLLERLLHLEYHRGRSLFRHQIFLQTSSLTSSSIPSSAPDGNSSKIASRLMPSFAKSFNNRAGSDKSLSMRIALTSMSVNRPYSVPYIESARRTRIHTPIEKSLHRRRWSLDSLDLYQFVVEYLELLQAIQTQAVQDDSQLPSAIG